MKKKMNGEFKRGEVYWVRDALTNGSEEAFRRPFIVVSSNEHNTKRGTIIGAALTTKPQSGAQYVMCYATGRRSWVMCDHLIEVDKSRLMEYDGKATDNEMSAIDTALRMVLDLMDDKKSTDDEVATRIASLEAEVESKNHRAQMFQRMYEKALDELAALKLEMDLKEKCSEKCDKKGEDRSEKRVETVEKVAVAEAKEKININTATAIEIVTTLGVNTNYAYKITQYRKNNGNFVDIGELRDVKGLPKDFVERYGNLIMIGENDQIEIKNDEIERPKIAKVNINTATAEEISEVSGLNIYTARKIRAYRNKHGLFKSVDELMNVDRFGKGCMSMYGDKFEV